MLITTIFSTSYFQVWFKNRRAKWRKQKREEQERIRKIDNHPGTITSVGGVLKGQNDELTSNTINLTMQNYSEDSSDSDLEVA